MAVGVHSEATLAVKNPIDSLRLLALRFLHLAEMGDCITADLKSMEFFIDPSASQFLSQ